MKEMYELACSLCQWALAQGSMIYLRTHFKSNPAAAARKMYQHQHVEFLFSNHDPKNYQQIWRASRMWTKKKDFELVNEQIVSSKKCVQAWFLKSLYTGSVSQTKHDLVLQNIHPSQSNEKSWRYNRELSRLVRQENVVLSFGKTMIFWTRSVHN